MSEAARRLIRTNVRRLRNASGISQEELAAAAGISREYLALIETRDVNPTVDVIAGLADALGVDVRDLFQPDDR